MTGLLSWLSLGIMLGWLGFALVGVWTTPGVAAIIGAALGALAVLAFRDTIVLRGLMAVLEPLAVILPVLALRHVAAGLGVAVTPFSTPALAVFLAAYLVFLAAAMGLLPGDPYRWGYAPLPVAAMVLAVCAWGAWQGNLFLPLAAVAGQALWVAGWGSSNWFDHVLHVLLVPIVAVVLLSRLVW